MTFYNTINETGSTLSRSESKNESQNEIVLDIYKEMKKPLSVYQAYAIHQTKGGKMLLMSFKRSITDLCVKDKLQKTDTMIKGPYGKSNYLYELFKEKEKTIIQTELF